MEAVKDASHLYEVERRARHAERDGFRINKLQDLATEELVALPQQRSGHFLCSGGDDTRVHARAQGGCGAQTR